MPSRRGSSLWSSAHPHGLPPRPCPATPRQHLPSPAFRQKTPTTGLRLGGATPADKAPATPRLAWPETPRGFPPPTPCKSPDPWGWGGHREMTSREHKMQSGCCSSSALGNQGRSGECAGWKRPERERVDPSHLVQVDREAASWERTVAARCPAGRNGRAGRGPEPPDAAAANSLTPDSASRVPLPRLPHPRTLFG